MLLSDLELLISAAALLVALALQPWRLLKAPQAAAGGIRPGNTLISPLLAALTLLPLLWALPRIHAMPLQLQWSGACLVVLTIGWPLAVPVFLAAGLASALIAPLPVVAVADAVQASSHAASLAAAPEAVAQTLDALDRLAAAWPLGLEMAVWLGIVPGTFALLIGMALRYGVGTHPFIYILGRGFLGTVLSVFAAGALWQALGHEMAHISASLSMVARWLMAWGDGFVTGMLTAIFVAFKPQWLATWSDALYLKK